MKLFFRVGILVFFIFSFIGCGKNLKFKEGDPKNVVVRFIESIKNTEVIEGNKDVIGKMEDVLKKVMKKTEGLQFEEALKELEQFSGTDKFFSVADMGSVEMKNSAIKKQLEKLKTNFNKEELEKAESLIEENLLLLEEIEANSEKRTEYYLVKNLESSDPDSAKALNDFIALKSKIDSYEVMETSSLVDALIEKVNFLAIPEITSVLNAMKNELNVDKALKEEIKKEAALLKTAVTNENAQKTEEQLAEEKYQKVLNEKAKAKLAMKFAKILEEKYQKEMKKIVYEKSFLIKVSLKDGGNDFYIITYYLSHNLTHITGAFKVKAELVENDGMGFADKIFQTITGNL